MTNAQVRWLVVLGGTALASHGAFAESPRPLPGGRDRPESLAGQLIAPPPADVVRTRTLQWVAERVGADRARLEAIGRLWGPFDEPPAPDALFERTIRSFALADPATEAFIEQCRLQRPPLLAPEAEVIERSEGAPFYRANMKLFYGRYLAQRQMYDEALTVFEDVPAADVVDPASLLFHQAVCQHRLMLKTEGLATIGRLLKDTTGVPERYATVAALMQHDLEALGDDSLDEVSRKMADVERRLTLGRTGQRVQKREDEIIAALDALIKKIEEQQGGGGGGGGNANRSVSPAQDSVIKGSTAPGDVDPRKLKAGAEWGDLPPRARVRARDLISREFPAHYRTAIEEFTRKGANRAASSGK